MNRKSSIGVKRTNIYMKNNSSIIYKHIHASSSSKFEQMSVCEIEWIEFRPSRAILVVDDLRLIFTSRDYQWEESDDANVHFIYLCIIINKRLVATKQLLIWFQPNAYVRLFCFFPFRVRELFFFFVWKMCTKQILELILSIKLHAQKPGKGNMDSTEKAIKWHNQKERRCVYNISYIC